MKKSRIFLIVLAILLCAILITTTMLSGTFAKYSTTVSAHEEGARVAKWGITVSSLGSDLAESYTNGNTLVIKSQNSSNVFAPGMSGSLSSFRVYGAAEVSYKVDFEGSFASDSGYLASSYLIHDGSGANTAYFPIIIGLYKTQVTTSNGVETYGSKVPVATYGLTGTHATKTYSDLTSLVNALNAELPTLLDENISPNVNKDTVYTIEWEWPMTAPDGNTYQTRELDTALGEALVKNPDSFDISINITLSVYQTR